MIPFLRRSKKVVKEASAEVAVLSEFSGKTSNEIVALIHDEIDTAEDRLLASAEEFLKNLDIPRETQLEEKAELLKSVGFTGSETVKKHEQLKKGYERLENRAKITTAFAELVRYYKQHYPLQKFLTVSEIDRICDKYGLIYAPVANYKEDVPDKNLKEIAEAKALEDSLKPPYAGRIYVTEYWKDVPKEIRDILDTHPVVSTPRPNERDILKLCKHLGYDGDFTGYIFKDAKVEAVVRDGLFIAAPPSHFDLTGLSKTGTHEFAKIQIENIKDPIVFRHCKAGIQVLSKWGLEAADPGLVNEIEN